MIPYVYVIEEIETVDLIATVLTLEDNNRLGMECISEVIYNRSKKNPENFRDVLLKKYQFSCLNIHTIKKVRLHHLVDKAQSRPNWKDALDIAKRLCNNEVTSHVGEATHYHVYAGKYAVKPYWTDVSLGGYNEKAKVTAFIGNHVFLKDVD